MCVCVFSSHSFWTSSSLTVPAGVTQEECHTGFFIHLLSAVRALIFLARRIQPFLSFVDHEVEFCVLTTLIVSSPVGHFLVLFFSFLVRKTPFPGVELTSQRVRGLRGTSKLPGRPAQEYNSVSIYGLIWSCCCCCCCCLHIKNRSDLYPVPFLFLLFKAKKRISVVTS